MPLRLSAASKQKVQKCLNGEVSITLLNRPQEWHYFAWRYNWDDGIEPLLWIVNQSLCDKGTALLIYWRGQPQNIQLLNTYENDEARGYHALYINLIEKIEERFRKDDFINKRISFNPQDDYGQNWVRDLLSTTHIPDSMFQPSPGQPVSPPKQQAGIRNASVTERRILQRNIQKGTAQLALTEEVTTSENILNAIITAIQTRSANLTQTAWVSYNDPILDLQWPWGEQVCTMTNWTWAVEDKLGDLRFFILSPDGSYCIHPNHVLAHIVNVPAFASWISELPKQIRNIQQLEDIREAQIYGWITRNTNKKQM